MVLSRTAIVVAGGVAALVIVMIGRRVAAQGPQKQAAVTLESVAEAVPLRAGAMALDMWARSHGLPYEAQKKYVPGQGQAYGDYYA